MMGQDFYVLRCYLCSTFQVYGQGTGKDCRVHTQKLNELRIKKEEEPDEQEDSITKYSNHPELKNYNEDSKDDVHEGQSEEFVKLHCGKKFKPNPLNSNDFDLLFTDKSGLLDPDPQLNSKNNGTNVKSFHSTNVKVSKWNKYLQHQESDKEKCVTSIRKNSVYNTNTGFEKAGENVFKRKNTESEVCYENLCNENVITNICETDPLSFNNAERKINYKTSEFKMASDIKNTVNSGLINDNNLFKKSMFEQHDNDEDISIEL
uniref:Uncharacterized protein n=1 Tax=Clastoptera arizonana TaxID=38151 RepID=A0A1B6E7J7_9HEMI